MARPGKSIEILLVGEYTLVRAGIRKVLETKRNFRVREEVLAEDALAAAVQHQPDIFVQDIDQGHLNYFDLLQELRVRVPSVQLVVLTAHSDEVTFRNAYRIGVSAVVPKFRSPETLLSAIERVHGGELWVDDLFLTSIFGEKINPALLKPHGEAHVKTSSVTRRELDIVRLIGRGYRNKQIAQALGISEATVRHHLTVIYHKLDVSDRLQLLIYAHRNNLIDLTPERYGDRTPRN